MKRRKILTWVDTRVYLCPECGQEFVMPRVIVDNHAAPHLDTSKEVMGIGGHLITCGGCNKKHLLQVEMTGSFFTGFAAGVKPRITLFRVLPSYQGLEVERERDLVMPGEEGVRRQETGDRGQGEKETGDRRQEEEDRPPDVEPVQSWELQERQTELLPLKREDGEAEEGILPANGRE